MLFSKVSFIILPTRDLPSVGFVEDLIVAHGGKIVDQTKDINWATIVLINDPFIDIKNKTLINADIFNLEVPANYSVTLDLMDRYNLPCIPLSYIGRWVAGEKLDVSSMPTMFELTEHDDSNEDVISIQSGKTNDGSSSCDTVLEEHVDSTENCEPNGVKSGHSLDGYNENIIEALDMLFRRYEAVGDIYRARSYKLAKQAIEQCHYPIISGTQAQADLEHVGPSIGKKIQEIIDTGQLKGLNKMDSTNQRSDYFMRCYSVGSTIAQKWNSLNVNNFQDVVERYPSEIQNCWKIMLGWAFYEDWSKRIPRLEVKAHFNIVNDVLAKISGEYTAEVLGSYVRGKETCGDIDILIYATDCNDIRQLSRVLKILVLKLFENGYIQCYLQSDTDIMNSNIPLLRDLYSSCKLSLPKSLITEPVSKILVRKSFLGVKLPKAEYKRCYSNEINRNYSKLHQEDVRVSRSAKNSPQCPPCRRLDLFTCKWKELGAARLHYTGSGEFNRWLRLRAISMGFMLTQHGLFKNGTLLESFSENKIFEHLGLKTIPNEDRNEGPWKNMFEL
ncbi:DNA-directed DNA polymerase IV [Maudiozyma humilis]|uniref:DNA polymerase n=1 Tax=Maudiozyma humilis TaxID=51915 RepID=A0AAV5RUM8_MAUHU|nr:DNA-directed DNA polymerase IV [Kazachstania humilis]